MLSILLVNSVVCCLNLQMVIGLLVNGYSLKSEICNLQMVIGLMVNGYLPKSEIANPKSAIRNPHSALRNPHSEIANPNYFTTISSTNNQLLFPAP
jgi:hypothetical protein